MISIARIGVRTLGLAALTMALSAQAAPYFWTDWTGATSNTNGTNFVANGTITTNASTINVTYSNAQGVSFIQTNGGTDYWANGFFGSARNAATSPYTSTQVDNIPTGTDIIALRQPGSQTLQFSQTVANPVFSFVSLNGNGYAFLDQDFEILSQTGNGNDCGFWGCGTATKVEVDLGNGHKEYRLNGISGEPHGTIRFLGAFDTLVWSSQSFEDWNGFTVGVQGTAVEVFQTPEPGSLALMGVAMLGIVLRRRRA
ncbi:MAG: PEP-CTERM sorting domain-containing protein [Burkholderiales bacterium]|nr:PEP-CTERM sorting domain-containing protein [Burkholderiales bacterium]